MSPEQRPTSYAVYAIGCQQNWYDAEKVAHALDNLGIYPETIEQADLIVILACSVRQKAVDRIFGLVENWRKQKERHIIVTACVLPDDRARVTAKVDALIPDQEVIKHLQDWLGAPTTTTAAHTTKATNVEHPTSHSFVPITIGCNNFCTFCAVPHTRGREQSRPKSLILAEIAGQVKKGMTSVTLLGQNVNSWGLSEFTPRDLRKNRDKGGRVWDAEHPSPFVELLRDIDRIAGLKSVSFLSPNPQDISSDLIEWMSASPLFSRTLNLPLQSGSDEVLKRMNRRYSAAEYRALVAEIRRQVPDIILSTDIIVGFPGETDADFAETVALAKEANFVKAFIGIYSPRTGTVAEKLYPDDIPRELKHARFMVLEKLINSRESALNASTASRD